MITYPQKLLEELTDLPLQDATFFVLFSQSIAFREVFGWGAVPRPVHPAALDALLKHLFPGVSSNSIAHARQKALDLDAEFLRCYAKAEKKSKNLEANYSRDLQLAKELAKKAKPGFHEETYTMAASRLAFQMR